MILLGSDRVLNFREVRVFGTSVPAVELYRGDASWSSVVMPGDNCIDGVDNDDANVCQGRREENTWVQIDFGETVTVHNFVIYNRRDASACWECASYPSQTLCTNRLTCGSDCGSCSCSGAGSTCGAELRVGDAACGTDMGGDVYDRCGGNLVCLSLIHI